ncbi:hypothetical protein P9112_004443 [Eukaryota sp. TZLM1-RC]
MFLAVAFITVLLVTVIWFTITYLDPILSNVSAHIIIGLGLLVSGSIIVLIPLDYESSLYHHCRLEHPPSQCQKPTLYISQEHLSLIWRFIYWITFFFVWVFMPFIRNLSSTAEFRLSERLRTALKKSLTFYITLGILALSGIIYLSVSAGLTFNNVISMLMSFASLWGLFLLIVLCGHGLVGLPKKLWRKSNIKREVKFCEFSASKVYSDLESARSKLSETLNKVTKTATQVPVRNPLYQYLSQVISKCPISAYGGSAANLINIGKGNSLGGANVDYDMVCGLNKEVMVRSSSLRIQEDKWDKLVVKYAYLKQLLSIQAAKKEVGTRNLLNSGIFEISKRDFIFYMHALPIVLKVLCVVCSSFTIVLLFSELSLVSDSLTSPLSFFLSKSTSTTLNSLLIMMPIGYFTLCGFFSLANLKKSRDYCILKKLTTPWSGIFLSGFMLRLIFPLCYNYLTILKLEETAFIHLFGPMEDVPILGVTISTWLPTAILLICFLALGECFTSVLKMFGVSTFDYEEAIEDAGSLVEGRGLLLRSKDILQREKISVEGKV